MATATATIADFALFSFWTCSGGQITEGPETMTETKVLNVDGVPEGATVQSASLAATMGTPITGTPRQMKINGETVGTGAQTVALTPTATGNGAYEAVFKFQAAGNASLSDGQHLDRLDVTNVTLTVTYTVEAPGPTPEPVPDVEWEDKPISVFAGDETRFGNNGLAVLIPTEGRLKTVAGGACEITMIHPIDPYGKWLYLIPGNIIRAPVPEETIENAFIGIEVDLYRTNTSAALREGPSEPSTITYETWSPGTSYPVGKKVTYLGKNYQLQAALTGNEIYAPPGTLTKWKEIPRTSSGAAVLVQLPSGSDLYFLEDAGSGWYYMSTPMGIEGYIKSSQVTYIRHLTPQQSDERTITEQLFRIKNVSIDTKAMEMTVYAEHVSYDLAAILVRDVKCSKAPPSLAINRIVDSLMMPYRGTVSTNLGTDNGTYTGAINGKNGIFAFLDPDNGIVPTFDARFSRDNWDLFVLQKTNKDRGARIEYGKNAKGITWKRSSESLVTRVVPVAKDAQGNDLYLPEQYIDSTHISEYPVIMMQRLAVKGQIGKDDGTDTNTNWTEETLFEEMRTKAQERYDVDKADVIYQEITVDFEQLGDTAEYSWLKSLEHVLLYDTVHAKDARVGLETALTVNELEWDIIRKKITKIKVSTTIDHGLATVAGYNLSNNSIGTEKLTEAAITEIANLLT